MQRSKITQALLPVAREAGEIIMRYYGREMEVAKKLDASPVTIADQEADDFITEALRSLTPAIPIISEESREQVSSMEVGHGTFWLVDPLDGTRSFIRGRGDFTVNIGLIVERHPVLGVIYAPLSRRLYYGWMDEEGMQAWAGDAGSEAKPIRTSQPPDGGVVIVASLNHRTKKEDEWLETISYSRVVGASSSLKFCVVAEGEAHYYPRFGPTMEWDTAAGHAILLAAGGSMTTIEGEPFLYGKPAFRNPGFIVKS